MERNRLYNRDHPHRESPESRKKSNRKYRISSYGLTQDLFDLLLDAQQNACGMCHEPFSEGQPSHLARRRRLASNPERRLPQPRSSPPTRVRRTRS